MAPVPLALTVNGRRKPSRCPATAPLLQVLRNDLQLNGPKYGCGLGECGACRCWWTGVAARSCVIPVGGVAGGASIRRSKGWARRSALHPVQQAFIDAQAAQCGYCLNGMIIRAVALLDAQPQPSERRCAARCRTTCAVAARIWRSCCGARAAERRASARRTGAAARSVAPTRRASQPRADARADFHAARACCSSRASRRRRPRRRGPAGRGAGNPAEGVEILVAVWDDGSVTALNGHVDLGTGSAPRWRRSSPRNSTSGWSASPWCSATPRGAQPGRDDRQCVDPDPRRAAAPAAAQARAWLLAAAAERLQVPVDALEVRMGSVRVRDEPARHVHYGELLQGRHVELQARAGGAAEAA